MTSMNQRLLEEAMRLSATERLELAEAIYESVESEDGTHELTAVQAAELRQRLEMARNDPLEGSSWAEARARIPCR